MAGHNCLVCVYFSLVFLVANMYCVPMSGFYPFGVLEGDQQLPIPPSSSSPVTVNSRVDLPVPVLFYGQRYDSIYVNSQGALSFNNSLSMVEPRPLTSPVPVIAPYWSPVDLSRGGNVHYRMTNDPALLQRAQNDILSHFPDSEGVFEPTLLLIVTWFQVQEFQGRNESNTFQVALLSNSNVTFCSFLYGNIEWGEFSYIGINPAQLRSSSLTPGSQPFMIPIALTNATVDIENTSNVRVPGFYAFRVDLSVIIEPGETVARFEQVVYSVNETETQSSLCVIVEEIPANTTVTLLVMPMNNGSAEAGSDYEEVDIRLNFGQGSGNRQCFNIVILDDMVFEGEENFTLILVPVNPPVIRTINVTVFIQDNEAGQFGQSFPFGAVVGDRDLQIPSNAFFGTSLQMPFTFYGYQETSLWISENGLLSFRLPLRDSNLIRQFDSISLPIIAPLWTDLELNRFGGRILFRMTTDPNALQHARNLTLQQFQEVDFLPTNVIVVTWFKVAQRFFSTTERDVNTFQVALVYNTKTSFAFFFYDQIVTQFSNNAGFATSNRYDDNRRSFMIPGVHFSNPDMILTTGSNTGVPGFYAFRVDRTVITQPGESVAAFEQDVYFMNETDSLIEVCVLLEEMPSPTRNSSVTFQVISQSNNSAKAGSDYEEVNVTLTFSQDSGNRQCFTITILDNSVFEDEENFILMILTESTPVTTVNASVFITDDEVGGFGESFPFGPLAGDINTDGRTYYNGNLLLPLQTVFTFYGSKETSLYINENGILSFQDSFRDSSVSEFDTTFHSQPLLAPLWTDLDQRRFGQRIILFRVSRDASTLERARNLAVQHFPYLNFEPTNAVIVTWFEVGHRFLGQNDTQVNTFQVALIHNNGTSFAFFFYNETVTEPRSANAGFASPSSFGNRGEFFMIPGVFSNSVDLTRSGNTGVPGFYAFRVDRSFITQPGEIWARFEQRLYFLNETDMHFEVCVLVDEIFVDNGISLLVMSLNNNSAEVGSDYEEVEIHLTFGPGSGNRQCFTVAIIDDLVIEGEENFILTLQSENATVTTLNSSVFIRDNDVGRFEESFPFGAGVGDEDLLISSSGFYIIRFQNPFIFYGFRQSYLLIYENGVLSLSSSFQGSSVIRDFNSFSHSNPLIAPFWTDLDRSRFGGRILSRVTRDRDTLEHAQTLAQQQFHLNFEPTEALIVTWFEVGHRFLGDNVNTFQAALVYNEEDSFVFFFYNETISAFRRINAGLAPSTSFGSSEPFMIPGVFNGNVTLANGSNTGVPGFYAFRVDSAFLVEPDDTIVFFDQAVYSVNESQGAQQVCMSVEGRISEGNLTIEVQSVTNQSAVAFLDYEPVSLSLTFSGDTRHRCFEVIIHDDSIFEDEEGFLLTLASAPGEEESLVGIMNASIYILSDDAGQFGESFPFGEVAGDLRVLHLTDNRNLFLPLSVSYSIYRNQERVLQVNENGILSFQFPLASSRIRDFHSPFSQPLIAPLWTDLDLRGSSSGQILFRTTRDASTLERAGSLVRQQFPDLNFDPSNVVIVTWFEVGHRFLSGVNTFQVVLVYNSEFSIVFFFYGNVSVEGARVVNVGFSPSSRSSGEPFMIPGVFLGDVNVANGSNTNVTGFYAFRVDQNVILEPRDVLVTFDQTDYTVSESSGFLEVCVSVQGRSWDNITAQVHNLNNRSSNASTIDYVPVMITLTFSEITGKIQCFNVSIVDDDLIEQNERFFLILQSTIPSVKSNFNSTVIITDNDVGEIGMSFRYGPLAGDRVAHPVRFSTSIFLPDTFSRPIIYGRQLSANSIQINSNGILSFPGGYSNSIPRDFNDLVLSTHLLAPFWSNVDLERFGNVFYRIVSDGNDLHRASILMNRFFPDVSVTVQGLVIVTWYRVAESTSSNSNASNTFQAAIVSGRNASFVLFFYGDIEWGEFSNIGFSPARTGFSSTPNGQPFMIPIALTNATVDIENTSNAGVPGLYAFRVDRLFISQPNDIIAVFEQNIYSVNEDSQYEVCVVTEGIPEGSNLTLVVISQSNGSAEVNSDYVGVTVHLTFGQGSGNRQCFNVMVLDDLVYEEEENFILTMQSENVTILTLNASVLIQDDDPGRFGESFTFGAVVGDGELNRPFNRVPLGFLTPVIFYGIRETSSIHINENGILSFRYPFTSSLIQELGTFRLSQSVIAPFWTDLDLSRFGGRVLFRMARDASTLEHSRNLTQQHFPDLDFEPTNTVIVTWFELGHAFLGNESNVNTFQAALIFNNRMSFVFFFYDQIVEGFRNISAGFSPSSQSFNANTAIPFNIPGVFTNETDLASDSNTGLSGVTGLYAFRTDHPFIVEPRDIVLIFDRRVYFVREAQEVQEVCLSMEGRVEEENITIEVLSVTNGTANDTTDYESVSILMTYSGNTTRQCFNLIIYDDSIFESEEGFFLVTVPTETAMSYVGVLNASVFIEDDDAGQFGASFPFGRPAGDGTLSSVISIFPLNRFPFFGERERRLYINENGILSFRNSFSSASIESFFSFRFQYSQPLIAPYWSDLSLSRARGGGNIFYRASRNPDILQQARNLTQKYFINVNFQPTQVIIVTWYKLPHRLIGNTELVNTFQVALVHNSETSFAFFFYETTTVPSDSVVVGFSPSSALDSRLVRPFMILPRTATNNIERDSNTGVTGLYAYRIHSTNIVQPNDIFASFEESVYRVNESVGYFEACIFVTGNATDSISIIIESRENEAQANSDYSGVLTVLVFGGGSSFRQCFNVTILEDTELEREERFSLVMLTGSPGLGGRGLFGNLTTSVFIMDNEVGMFGTSFPFGEIEGDTDLTNFNRVSLSTAFPYYGRRESSLYINENGVLSFRSSIGSRLFNNLGFSHFEPIIAPHWTDLRLQTQGGSIFYRISTDPNSHTLQYAKNLTQKHFLNVDFQPTNVIVVTWYEVAHRNAELVNNTFQVALVYNSEISFIFFFYEETNVPSRLVVVGFSPSSAFGSTLSSFMIPRSDIDDIEDNSNAGVPGFYAFRTDTIYILQPDDLLVSFGRNVYGVGESEGEVEVCVTLVGNVTEGVNLTVVSQERDASVDLDYSEVFTNLTFGEGLQDGQCFSVTILEDMETEAEERFNLTIQTPKDRVVFGNFSATVLILDNDVGQFGASFPFNFLERRLRLSSNDNLNLFLPTLFPFYGGSQRSLFISENGVLSFSGSLSSIATQRFEFSFNYPLIAPYWTDLSLSRFGGNIFYHFSTDSNTLQRAKDLIDEQFPSVDFQPLNVIVVTWYRLPHSSIGSATSVNSFQAALVFNQEHSFALFFYEVTSVPPSSVRVGFSPSFRFSPNLQSLLLPRNDINAIENGTNTGVTGFFAYRIDLDVILQPQDLLVSFEEVVYHVNESVGWFEVCVTLEANVTGGVNLTVISQDNSTTVGSDYAEIATNLTFGELRQCFIVTILEDSEFEGEERFLLTLQTPKGRSAFGNLTASVIIIEDDAGQFGMSFPFGPILEDESLQLSSGSNLRISLPTNFPFYNRQEGTLFINENGILSFRDSFSSSFIRDFGFSHFQSLVAPYWTDLSLSRKGGEIFYRMSTDPEILERAGNLTQEEFPLVNFQPTNIIIVTWYRVPHRSLGSAQLVNTFQVALVHNDVTSFTFFFYNETNVPSSSVVVGFSPSRSTGQSFMIPRRDTDDIEDKTNTGVPGFYAYRTDLLNILAQEDILASFEEDIYRVRESAGHLEVCVSLVVGKLTDNVTLMVRSRDNNASVGLDYGEVFINLTFEGGSNLRRCFNVAIFNDSEFEREETFTLTLLPPDGRHVIINFTASVFIIDDDVGQFGNSFPFGEMVGDRSLRTSTNFNIRETLSPPFPFYGQRENILNVNENGILSFRNAFTSVFTRDFGFFHSQPLIAPYWTDLSLSRRGDVLYRMSTDADTLLQARNLIQNLFPSANFQPTNVVILTWYKVPHVSLGTEVNTFQVALVYDRDTSFALFFYNETNVPSRSVTVGFSPSSSDGSTGQSFMIPRSDTDNIERNSNTRVPGFYAYRTDRNFILQTHDVLLRFEERVYRVSESIGEFEVCVSVEGAMMELVSLTVRSQNGSASVNSDYVQVSSVLMFGGGFNFSQCFDVRILEDNIPEEEEGFSLGVVPTEGRSVLFLSTSVFIQDNDVGQFGSSFDFGPVIGDSLVRPIFDGAISITVQRSFAIYGQSSTSFLINENGVLSFYTSSFIRTPRPFSLTNNGVLIAPFWSNIDLNRFGSIFYRTTTNRDTLSRATRLVEMLFPNVLFFLSDQVTVVTWFRVAESTSLTFDRRSNTFQVVLVSGTGSESFVFFFYGDIEWGSFSNIGFEPSRYSFYSVSGSQPFMIPIALTSATVDINQTSNFEIPGFYAFRVDTTTIQQPKRAVQFTRSTYTVLESAGFVEICVNETRQSLSTLVYHIYTLDGSAQSDEDYTSLSLTVTSSGEIKCFNVTLIDDVIFESPSENLTVQLRLLPPLIPSTVTADIIILDSDVGQFGASFPFGVTAGDATLQTSNFRVSLPFSFPFYGERENTLFVNKNGILSFRSSFSSTIRQDLNFSHSQPLISPYWTDLSLRRIFYRTSTDMGLLEQARNLTLKYFPNVNSFQPTNIIIVTWYRLPHESFGSSQLVNTFQVALACNSVNSFVFFFYEETNVPSRFVTVGFSPSSSGGSTGQSFMIPRSDTNNIENGTNTGVPGFYAYRTDRDVILQPEDILVKFEERMYRVNESVGQFEVCVFLEGNIMNITLIVRSQNNNSASVNLDYVGVSAVLTFSESSMDLRQCFNVTILNDTEPEKEEGFFLTVLPVEGRAVISVDASVFIQDSSIGQFGLSFEFGLLVGDEEARPLFDGAVNIILPQRFRVYGQSSSTLSINENGLLSFFGSFVNNLPRRFTRTGNDRVLIAPFWSNVDLNRFGRIFYRTTTRNTTLSQATRLVNQLFPNVPLFTSNQVTVVTWFKVAQFSSSRDESNTFQAVLVSGIGGESFVFFFYSEIEWGSFSNIGFEPSRFSNPQSQPFMIPIGLTNATVNIEETSNLEFPGFYAFRVDSFTIQQPQGAIEFVRSSYAASESNGLIQICVNERRPLLPPTLLYNIQTANGTAEDGEDFDGFSLNVTSTGGIKCYNVTIIDDTIFEPQGSEVFTVRLRILYPLAIAAATANVMIRDNDVGAFGASFPFGGVLGDRRLQFFSALLFLSTPFPFYGLSETNLYVNEKGLLSFRGTFSSSPIRDFSFSHSQPLIAPLWTDLHSRQGGEIFYRMSTDPDTLQRAKNLTKKHFLTVNFQPINIIIVTWYQVPHESIGNPQLVNTFQVALVYNNETSFAFFFYNETNIPLSPVVVGFSPSSSVGSTHQSFMIPRSGVVDTENGTNTGVPGFYAYRLTSEIILQPQDLPLSFDESIYRVSESADQLEVCVSLTDGLEVDITSTVRSLSNGSASVDLDYIEVFKVLTFGEGSSVHQCFNMTVVDDTVFEEEEGFFLVVIPEEGKNVSINASVFILDNDMLTISEHNNGFTPIDINASFACMADISPASLYWTVKLPENSDRSYDTREIDERRLLSKRGISVERNGTRFTLTALASQQNNNTEVQCRIFPSFRQGTISNTSKLIIIGPPSPPGVKVRFISVSEVLLEWGEPFSWDGHEVQGYRISRVSPQGIEFFNTTNTSHSYSNSSGTVKKSCQNVTFMVSAYNDLGPSEPTSVTTGLPILPGPFGNVSTRVQFPQSRSPEVNITVQAPQVCDYQMATLILSLRRDDVRREPIILSRNYQGRPSSFSFIINSGLEANATYSLTLQASTITGNITSSKVAFDTKMKNNRAERMMATGHLLGLFFIFIVKFC